MVSPKKWLERYRRSKKAQAPFKEDYIRFRRAYMGDYSRRKKDRSIDEKMYVNYVYQLVETISPTIFSGNPNIIITAKKQQNANSAANMEANINYWLKELNADEELKCALFDAFFGPAAVETGWEYVTEMQEDSVTDPNGVPLVKEVVKYDRPFFRWRNFWDIFLDVDVPRRKDGRFLITKDIITWDDFVGMQGLDETVKKRVKPTMRPDDTVPDSEYSQYNRKTELKTDQEWVEILTIWDKEHERRIIMSPQIEDAFLANEDWPYEIDYRGDPFPITIYDGKPDYLTPYTFSEIRPIWGHIEERDRLRTAFSVHMRRAQPKYVYNKNAGTRAQIAKFFNSRSDEATELNNPDMLKLAPVAEMPPELYKWEEILKNDLDSVSAMNEFNNDVQADTATEASILEGRGVVRKKDRSQKFEQFVVAAAAKLGQLCQQFQDRAVDIEITNDENTDWMQLTKHEIQGDFRYEMEPGVMEYKNEALRKQQILKYAELMANNPNVNQRNLAVKLTKQFDLDPDDILLSPDQVAANAPKPQPMIKFKPIDLEKVASQQAQAETIMSAMEQNGVIPPLNPQNPAMAGQVPTDLGQEALGNLGGPMGGKVPLNPVEGQQIQPASQVGGQL